MQPKFTQRSFMLQMKTIATAVILFSSICFSYAQKQNKLQQNPEAMSLNQWHQINGKQIGGIVNNSNSQLNNDAGKVFPSSGINPIQSPQSVCTTWNVNITGSDPTTSLRSFRDGVPKTCAAPGTCQAGLAGSFNYQIFQWTNPVNQCVTVTYSATTTNFTFVTVFSAAPVLTNLCTNWVADPGSSALMGTPIVFSFTGNPGTTYYFLVTSIAGVPAGCTISIDAPITCFASPCTGTPAPGNTLASLNPVGPGTPFTLSVSNNPPFSGFVHSWQSAPSNTGPWTTLFSGPQNTYTTSQVVATYYRDSVWCTGSSQFGFSTPVYVTMNPCGWSYSTPYPVNILDAPAVTVGNNIYVFAGVSNGALTASSRKFDGTTWTSIAPYPVATEYPAACSDGVNAYIMGGYSTAPDKTLNRYNVATNTYTPLAASNIGTWAAAAVYLNGKIYKFGGSQSSSGAGSNALEIYDIAGNTWSPGANMPNAPNFCSGVAVGNYVYAIGGIAGTATNKTYRYDPATNTWDDAAIADLPVDRWGSAAYIYGPYSGYGSFAMAGGYVGGVISKTAIMWDPNTNAWSPLPDMNTVSARFAGASLNGSLYAIGGRQTNSFTGSMFNQKLQCTFPACSGTPAPGNTIGPSFVCVGQSFTLSLQNVPSVSGLTFQWQSSPDGVTYSDIAGATAGTYTSVFAGTAWYRCRVTCSGNSANSTPLKVSDGQGVFTVQPVNTSIQCGGTGSISFTATGLSLTYRWEYRVNSSSPWQNVTNGGVYSGATTNTLTLTNVTTTMNGYQYRGLMEGPCTAIDYTNIVTLTVSPLIATVNPSSATICTGTIQQLRVTNQLSAPPPVTQTFSSGTISIPIPDATAAGINSTIPVSLPAGAAITGVAARVNISGHTWDGDLCMVLRNNAGQIVNVDFFISATGAGPSSPPGFVNTVMSSSGTAALSTGVSPYTGTFRADLAAGSATFGGAPSGPTGFLPTTTSWATFMSSAGTGTGNWTLAVYDAFGGDIGTLTNWSLDITYTSPTFATGIWTSNPAAPNTMWLNSGATIPYAGTPEDTIWVNPTVNTVYTVVITTPTPCVSAPTNVTVNVTNPVTNLTIPATKSACVGDNVTITATANGGPITWQWQVSDNGGVTYTNISGATSATLTLNNVSQLMNNYRYRVTATASPCGSVSSASFTTLIVNPLPTVTLSANPSQVMPGVTTFVTASSTPAGASYTWTLNGVPITGATTSSVFADVDRLGSYKVTVTDINGCVRTSSELVISATDNPRLFIYPNPNNGQFQARLYSPAIALYDAHTLRIFNSAGAVMLTKTFPITSQYVRMDFDMRGYAGGVYVARVTHNFTGKTVSARFVIQH